MPNNSTSYSYRFDTEFLMTNITVHIQAIFDKVVEKNVEKMFILASCYSTENINYKFVLGCELDDTSSCDA